MSATLHTYRVRVARSADHGIGAGVQQFSVQLEERMTVLDALFQIQREQDETLSFRCACRVGMCGTCAITINGRPSLACKTRPRELGGVELELAPLPHLPVVRDLVVSLRPFFAQWKQVLPAFRPVDAEATAPARIPAESEFAKAIPRKRDCITCGACFAACGVKATSGEYLGPAAINKAFLRILDPRDGAKRERIARIDSERGGVWRCHTQFQCTDVCPKKINLTDTVTRLKRALLLPGRLGQ